MSSSEPDSLEEAYEDLRCFLDSESFQLDDFGYRLCSKLGQGAFGRVYEVDLVVSSSNTHSVGPEPESEVQGAHCSSSATHNTSKYALKVIRHRFSTTSGSDSKKSIDREVRILQRLHGKGNVSQLIKYSEQKGVSRKNSNFSLLLMELADQGSLTSYLNNRYKGSTLNGSTLNRNLSAAELEHFFTEMALGVQQVHDMGVLHLDIKLCNFLVYSNRTVTNDRLLGLSLSLPTIKLADFGVACIIKELNRENNYSICLSDAIESNVVKLPGRKGTIPYMSPEVVSPHVEIGKPSDIWSLGIAFYVMQYGFYPAKHAMGAPDMEMLFRIRDATKKIEFPLPKFEASKDLNRLLSVSLIVLAKGCLEYEAAHRLNANELVSLLKNNDYSNPLSNRNERIKSALSLLKHKKETATRCKFIDNLDVIGTLKTCYMGETVKKILLEGSSSESLNEEEEKGVNFHLNGTPRPMASSQYPTMAISEFFSEEGALEESDLHLGMDKVCVIDVEEGLETTVGSWPSPKTQTHSKSLESSDSNVEDSEQLQSFPIILTLFLFVGLLVIAGTCCLLNPSKVTAVNTPDTVTIASNLASHESDHGTQEPELGGPRLILGKSLRSVTSNDSFDGTSVDEAKLRLINCSSDNLVLHFEVDSELKTDGVLSGSEIELDLTDRELVGVIDGDTHNDNLEVAPVSDCAIDAGPPELAKALPPTASLTFPPFRILVKTVLVVIIAGLSIISIFTFVNWLNWLVFRSKEFSDPYVLKDRCDSNKEVYGDSQLLCGSKENSLTYLDRIEGWQATRKVFYSSDPGVLDYKTGKPELPWKKQFDENMKKRDEAAETLEKLNTDFLDLKTKELDETKFPTEKMREKKEGTIAT